MKSESTEESALTFSTVAAAAAAATVEKEIEDKFCIFANIWVIWVNWVNLGTVPGKYRKAKDGSPKKHKIITFLRNLFDKR